MNKNYDEWIRKLGTMYDLCVIKPMDFKTQYLGEWVWQADCNNCAYLNLTEEQQEYQNKGIHRCLYYDERVFHRTNNQIHNRMIYPCDKCYKDKHKAFIKR